MEQISLSSPTTAPRYRTGLKIIPGGLDHKEQHVTIGMLAPQPGHYAKGYISNNLISKGQQGKITESHSLRWSTRPEYFFLISSIMLAYRIQAKIEGWDNVENDLNSIVKNVCGGFYDPNIQVLGYGVKPL